MCSCTVSDSTARSSCGTNPDILDIKSRSIVLPFNKTSPVVFPLIRLLIVANNVVLPAPLN